MIVNLFNFNIINAVGVKMQKWFLFSAAGEHTVCVCIVSTRFVEHLYLSLLALA